MGNNVTLIPKQPARHSLLTNTENVVYMPLASKHSHGIVKIGDGLNVTADSLVYVDFESGWFADTLKKLDDVINNDIKIGNANGGFGTKNTETSEDGSIAIGEGAKATIYRGIAIGFDAEAGAFSSISLGNGAKTYDGGAAFGASSDSYGELGVSLGWRAKSNNNIQIGKGSNNKEAWSAQFYHYNIMDGNGKLHTNEGTFDKPNMVKVVSESSLVTLLTPYQTKTDNTLLTVNKTVSGGINELKNQTTININNIEAVKSDVSGIKKNYATTVYVDNLFARVSMGGSQTYVFETRQNFIDWLDETYSRTDGVKPKALNIGDMILIEEMGVPDYWVKSKSSPMTIDDFREYEAKIEVPEVKSDMISITKNDGGELQAVALKNGYKHIGATVSYHDFTGWTRLETEDFEQLAEYGSIVVDDETITFDENGVYVTPDEPTPKELVLTGDSVLTSEKAFSKHTQILVEFETDGIHAGFDCVLHPYDSTICFVTYDVLVNGQPNFGTAYLDDLGHVVINVPVGLTFTNVHAQYVSYGG